MLGDVIAFALPAGAALAIASATQRSSAKNRLDSQRPAQGEDASYEVVPGDLFNEP